MIEHPERRKFRELCIATLMRFPVMQTTGNYYHYGGNDPRKGSDCSGHLVGSRRILGYRDDDQIAQDMHDECVRENRPRGTGTLGELHFYGSSVTKIGHVTLAYDDLLAIGANNGTKTTKSRTAAKARSAGWQFCDPHYRNDHQATYMPDWWPWIRVTTDTLNLRDGVGTSAVILQTLPANTVVELQSDTPFTADGYDWYGVNVGEDMGWVAGEWLKR